MSQFQFHFTWDHNDHPCHLSSILVWRARALLTKPSEPFNASAYAMHARIVYPLQSNPGIQIKYKAAPIAAAPQIGAAVITTPPAFEDVVSVAAAARLMLLISLAKLLFAAPVAVAATEERDEIALEASLCAAEIALFARLVPVEMAPPAYDVAVEKAPPA